MPTVGNVVAHKHGKKRVKKWGGSEPICNICNKKPKGYFVDGRTRMGPWALMCPACHKRVGVGLGTSFGQKYDADTLEKLEG